MARIRSLKPEAFQSESLAAVSLAAERTFFGLSTVVDDQGRITDKPVVLNGALWSMRGEVRPHTAADFENELRELAKEDLICRYIGCDGKKYLHLVTWTSHQKVDHPGKPRIPRCSIHALNEQCGVHDARPCPPPRDPSREFREDSRDSRDISRMGGSGQNAQNGQESTREGLGDSRESLANASEGLAQTFDLQEARLSRESRESSESVALGSRIRDLGSVKALADDTPSAQLSLLPDLAPTAPSPTSGKPETQGQQINRIARTYTDRVKLSKWEAVQGVVRAAIKATDDDGHPIYTEQQILDGLQKLIGEKRAVTKDTLRIAMEGPPIPSQRNSVDQRVLGTLQTAAALSRRLDEQSRMPAGGFTPAISLPSGGFAS